VLIGTYQRRLPDFDDKVISLYTRGMSTREIQATWRRSTVRRFPRPNQHGH
jgi:transposase-like protein